MSDVKPRYNNVNLCESHSETLTHVVSPKCQFCEHDKWSQVVLDGMLLTDTNDNLKSEVEELKTERDELLKQNADYDELGLKYQALKKERDELKARVKFLNGALDLVLVNITQNITSARQEIEDEYGYDYFEREGE